MSDSCDGDDGSNEEDGDDEENPFAETPVKTNCTGTEYIDSVPAAAVHAAAVAIALPHLPEAAASAVVTADKPVAMEESSQESTRWDGTSSDDDRTLQALEAKEAVSQPWSEEGSGDLSVAPKATNTEEFEAAKADNIVEKMDETASGKLTTHQKLNARSAAIIPAFPNSESSTTSSDSVKTTVTVKAASEATHQLGRIPKLTLPLMAESSQGDSQSSMESTASNGSSIPVDESNSPRPPAPLAVTTLIVA
jgi:hypothetical protein